MFGQDDRKMDDLARLSFKKETLYSCLRRNTEIEGKVLALVKQAQKEMKKGVISNYFATSPRI